MKIYLILSLQSVDLIVIIQSSLGYEVPSLQSVNLISSIQSSPGMKSLV
jgi:hypothetical protein